MESMSLFDRKYTGGLHGHAGYDFEDSYVLSQLPGWLRLPDLDSFQRELLTDLELFFGSGRRWFIQIKKHSLETKEFRKIIQSFQNRETESSGEYQKYIIASLGLSRSLTRLSGRLERFRSAENLTEAELANTRKELAADLEGLKCESYVELIIEKVCFDSANESVTKEDSLRSNFTSSLVREYRIRQEDAENIYLQTARLLVVERGKSIRLSLFEAALKQKRLEADTQSLSDFDLITPEFLDSRSDDSVSYFYDGTVPTWSDIVHLRDIPRDIMPEILNRVHQVDHGRVLVPILAEAGEGKSTFLHRMAAELAGRHKTVLCRRRDRITIAAEEVRSVAEMADQCVYVFVDDAARVQNLKGFIESVAALPHPIVLVVASRPYEWVPFKSVYGANLEVQFQTDSNEWSLEGATDNEIGLLFRRLGEAELINSLSDEEIASLIDSYKERTKRKLLVLVLELTKGKRVAKIIRDECERVRQMGDSVLQAYRYVCLMGSVHSFITRSILKKLVKTESVDLDIVGRLPGLVDAIGENIYARHDRIAEIAADILFEDADDQRGNALCEVITLALKGAQSDVVHALIGALY